MSQIYGTAYEKTLDYLYTSLPAYQRQGQKAIKKMGLEKITHLCNELGHSEKKFKSIHVAGTNGKGSTSHALASVLQAAGYKTGLYTSPHIKDFRERIRMNGKVISKGYVIDFIHKHRSLFEKVQASFFEMSVALAFSFFAEKKIDIAVIEVGLGGRLDATNIIVPEVAVITNISREHTNILGSTLEKIAFEKAGIIKSNVPVVISEYQQPTASVFEKVVKVKHAALIYASACYQVELVTQRDGYLVVHIRQGEKMWLHDLIFDGGGFYQINNIPGILGAIAVLNKKGWAIQDTTIRSGLSTIKQRTGLLGRWQVVSDEPKVIVDAAHNSAGIKQVIKQLSSLSYNKLHIILGLVKKSIEEITAILNVLPLDATYYFVQAHTPRAMDTKKLVDLASSQGLQGISYNNVHRGLTQAQTNANKEDVIFIGGSIYIVAEVL